MNQTSNLTNNHNTVIMRRDNRNNKKNNNNDQDIRNKRKSEVLIAAKSLDHEIQNVKNLKRLSIGSMDLLIDPELEFRVNSNSNDNENTSNNNANHNDNNNNNNNIPNRKSWEKNKGNLSSSNNSSIENISNISNVSSNEISTLTTEDSSIDLNNDTSIDENSIDITRAEYLHQDGSLSTADQNNNTTNQRKSKRVVINNSIDDDYDNDNDNDLNNNRPNLSHRKLSGVGFLRRGTYNVNQSSRKSSLRSRNNNLTTHKSANNNRNNSNSNNDINSDNPDEIKNNLLWVPASQHPSVKPENYLELVHDTLQNINSNEDNSAVNRSANNEAINRNDYKSSSRSSTIKRTLSFDESNKENINTIDKNKLSLNLKRHSSLVRRPSGLRKSYTELEDLEDLDDLDIDEDTNSLTSSKSASSREIIRSISNKSDSPTYNRHSGNFSQNRRSVSLKDITEELTKISNSVGLTNDDAITLARTLSMTGSYENDQMNHISDEENITSSNNDNDNNNNNEGNNTDDDNRLASNMFMKNGLSIPTRSSLRRSKFNTYKIRSSSTSSSISRERSRKHEPLPFIYPNRRTVSSPTNESHKKIGNDKKTTFEKSPNIKEFTGAGDIAESPGSISDLYDHYRSSSGDWDNTENEENDSQTELKDDDHDISSFHTSQESSFNSQEISNDSVLYQPANTKPFVYERIRNSETDENNNNNRNERPWSWINSNQNSEENLQNLRNDNVNYEYNDTKENDFINANVEINRKIPEGVNHSKNRHLPIFTLTKDDEKKTKQPATFKHNNNNNMIVEKNMRNDAIANNVTDEKYNDQSRAEMVNEPKKETLEEKFVKLFKRKNHKNQNRSSNEMSSHIKNSIRKSQSQDDLKKKISKFRSKNKKQSLIQTSETSPINEKTKPEQSEPRDVHVDNNFDNHTSHSGIASNVKNSLSEKISDSIKRTKSLENVTSNESMEEDMKDDVESLPTLQPAVSVTSLKNNKNHLNNNFNPIEPNNEEPKDVVDTSQEVNDDDFQQIVNVEDQSEGDASMISQREKDVSMTSTTDDNKSNIGTSVTSTLPARKLTFADVKMPTRPNAPIQFTDSAFGFPLPMLTVSTVIMFDHRLGINVERAIYRLSHLKLSDPKKELRQQVVLSNFMYAYLNLVNHTLYMEQSAASAAETNDINGSISTDNAALDNHNSNPGLMENTNNTLHNDSNETIVIPDIN